MGFFSLLHSGVIVRSNGQQAVITKNGFLGHEPVEVVEWDGPDSETVLIFDRSEGESDVAETLGRAARYGDLEVTFNGKSVPREDFLNGALFVKEVSGVRIGVHADYFRSDWNFHGRVIHGRHHLPSLSHATVDTEGKRGDLYVRIDVQEARYIHLKLPDRTAIVEDDSFTALCREAKRALYEYLATLPEHTASFSDFSEARNLGVDLKEASPWFRTFHEGPSWEGTDEASFVKQTSVVATREGHAIVDRRDEFVDRLAVTFMIAVQEFCRLPVIPIDDITEFEGYSWYGSIPRLRRFELAIDGAKINLDEDSYPTLTVADSIQLSFVLERAGVEESIVWDLPFAGFRHEDWGEEAALTVTRSSLWAGSRESLPPFDLVDAAVYIAFSPSDDVEADSSETQLEFFQDNVRSAIIGVMGGTLAQTKHALHEALFGWRTDVSGFLRELNVSEIHLVKNQTGQWESELVTAPNPNPNN